MTADVLTRCPRLIQCPCEVWNGPTIIYGNALATSRPFYIPILGSRSMQDANRRQSCPEQAHNKVATGPNQVLSVSDANIAISVSDYCSSNSSSYNDLDTGSRKKTRRSPHKRIMRFRDEVERICSKAGSQLRDGLDTIKARLSPSRDIERGPNCRNIRIEYQSTKRRHRDLVEDDLAYDLPDHNYSTALNIHPLSNGIFSAELDLDNFPPEDDIIVRIRNYKLEIFLHRKSAGRKDHAVSRPYRCGEIDLPIYVDPLSLEFTVDDGSLLTIEARTKFFLSRRLSISTDDINVKHGLRHGKSPVVRRKESPNNTRWYVDTSASKKYVSHRSRSNTN